MAVIGERIGSYTIVEKLGEGGMGVVYRATDARLHRDVALKLIPETLAKDPQIMGRFEREAQVLASLNHPNIASIYGVEESGGQRALVMELVEGEELATRIDRGRIPLEEALRISLLIAEALEAAHDRGVVHRDLKPANIKLAARGDTSGGALVKILDFGLAKALQGDAAAPSSPDPTRSPTLSVAATQAGMILGTAGYMSPEQARALPADRRADIWSFGVILYELLAGRRAFAGDTVADTLAKVIEREPDWTLLPATTPAPIKALLERCLVKSPRHRLQAIGEARLVIEDSLRDLANAKTPTTVVAPPPAEPRPRSGVSGWRSLLPWAIAAVTSVLAAIGFLGRDAPAADPTPLMRLEIVVGQDPLDSALGSSVAFAPDGTRIAYVEADSERQYLYLRSLDQTKPVLLAEGLINADGPYQPFFSPDGKWIGYVTPSELRKVPVSGGTPLKICTVLRSRGATWLPDDTIVVSPGTSDGLSRVPVVGGTLTPVTELDAARGETTHRWPQVLPGGDAVLFTSRTKGTFEAARLEVVSLESGERKVVYEGGSYGRYVPSGHLVFVSGGTLFAVAFDPERREVIGSPVPAIQEIASSESEGGAQFDFSSNGHLAYLAGGGEITTYPILTVDRDGSSRTLWTEAGAYANPRLSPDGERLALTVLRDRNWDVWVFDLDRGVANRLTFGDSLDSEQIWSPDGESLIFSSDQDGVDSLFRKRADGSGETERLTEATKAQWASSSSPDGRYVAFTENDTGFDIGLLDLTTGKTRDFLATEAGDSVPDISPDGRWIAHASEESGRSEIYVRPFPDGAGKWQVSDAGGTAPRWSGDGKELFWRNDTGIVVAEVETAGPKFRSGRSRQLFTGPFQGGLQGIGIAGYQFTDYDVSPDGQHFVMFPDPRKEGRETHQHLTLVTGWFGELERLQPARGGGS
jgi:serine/threonine-protein kinase